MDVEELKSVLQKAREILKQRKKQENDSLAYSGQELSNLLKKALRGEAAEESAFCPSGLTWSG